MDDVIQWLLNVKLNKWGLLLSTLATEYVALAYTSAPNILGGIPNISYCIITGPKQHCVVRMQNTDFFYHSS